MMLRRLAIAALLALAPSLAMAESPRAVIAATPPTADNGDRIATTAWVNNFVNAGLPLASGKIWIGSAGNIATAQTPSGDLTMSNAGVFTFGTVNANVGSFGSATQCATITVNAKGLITAASAATCTPAVGSITGLGAGVATALAVATGTNAGSFITYNGPAGTPSAIVLTAGTGLPISTGVSGLGAGCATFLGTPSSANLRGCLTDEVGTGAAYFVGGALGTPASGTATNLTGTAAGLTAGTVTTNANLTGPVTSVGNATSLALGQLTNSLGANVAMNNTANYFDGPSVAQGSTGTWFASGTATVSDTAASTPTFYCKLWDGTTVIASAMTTVPGTANAGSISLSGYLASPAGNIRISCRDPGATTGIIVFNGSGNSKDSTLSAFRVQ